MNSIQGNVIELNKDIVSEKEFNLFSEGELSDLFRTEKKIISDKILKKPLPKTRSGKEKLAEQYFKKHHFEPLSINFDRIRKEKYISKASKYLKNPKRIVNMEKVLFITYRFPFKGNSTLLHYIPAGGIRNWTERVFISHNSIGFEKVTYIHSKEDFHQEIEEVLGVIKKEIGLINNQIKNYNESLKDYINKLITQRSQKL